MLKLTKIVKEYLTGSEKVTALKGVSMAFRKSEFVSILGPSGCGKTTLLNIVGGLDRYTSGDLVINGKSTKEFKDGDWDTYRNHSIGFVFQSYNLITHQTVLRNVELALTLSGVSKDERRRRAIEALQKVGLGDQLKKKPTQMSGGQMQRVAIARALVNDPDILLADEPTGALDSVTSVQIMDILKEIAKEKLIIMVTHNGELAEEYSSRIIRLQDGLVIGDTNPYSEEEFAHDEKIYKEEYFAKLKEEKENKTVNKGKKSMSFFTALALSFNNLMTKKGRTILTALAGSIGIIGIALILSLSNGIQTYIDKVQEETLSSYPVQIDAETVDLSSLLNGMMQSSGPADNTPRDPNKIYSNSSMLDLMNSLNELGTTTNNLEAFKAYLDAHPEKYEEYVSAIKYAYNLDLHIYSANTANGITKANPSEIMAIIMELMYGISGSQSSSYASMMGGNMNVFGEILPALDGAYVNDMLYSQYDVIYGDWPKNENEIVLIVDSNNQINDIALYSLGIKDQNEFKENLAKLMMGETVEASETAYTFSEICSYEYKLVLPTAYYENVDGKWVDKSQDETFMRDVLANSKTLKISGILRPAEDVASTALSGNIGYTYALTQWYIKEINSQKIVTDQKANEKVDILSGLEFATKENTPQTPDEKLVKINNYVEKLTTTQKADLYREIIITPTDEEIDQAFNVYMDQMTSTGMSIKDIAIKMMVQYGMSEEAAAARVNGMSDEELKASFKQSMLSELTEKVKEQKAAMFDQMPLTPELKVLALAKYLTEATPEQINHVYETYVPSEVSDRTLEEVYSLLGVVDLESPKSVYIYAADFAGKDKIQAMVDEYNTLVSDDDQIKYTDYVALIMSGVSDIIAAISYVLIGFVSISLIVSSIMIGIITYISVLERTKEIGILRAIGASKRDISRVFNAETLIEGFASGLLGIGASALLLIPINLIIFMLSDIAGLKAILPTSAAIVLILISMFLTFIAGLIPSKLAAKKDPVEALRTE